MKWVAFFLCSFHINSDINQLLHTHKKQTFYAINYNVLLRSQYEMIIEGVMKYSTIVAIVEKSLQ